MLPPELVQSHFNDLKRGFELVARDKYHNVGLLPTALFQRLVENGYIIVGQYAEAVWNDDVYAFYTLYAAWQEKLTAFIAMENRE